MYKFKAVGIKLKFKFVDNYIKIVLLILLKLLLILIFYIIRTKTILFVMIKTWISIMIDYSCSSLLYDF